MRRHRRLENSFRNCVRHPVHRYLGDYGDPYLSPIAQLRNPENQPFRFVPQIRFSLESLPGGSTFAAGPGTPCAGCLSGWAGRSVL